MIKYKYTLNALDWREFGLLTKTEEENVMRVAIKELLYDSASGQGNEPLLVANFVWPESMYVIAYNIGRWKKIYGADYGISVVRYRDRVIHPIIGANTIQECKENAYNHLTLYMETMHLTRSE